MPAILGPAAQKMNADTAGLTHVAEPMSTTTGAPHGHALSEAIDLIPNEYGGLAHLFTDGMPAVVETAVSKPTDSVLGKLGGLVPKASNNALSAGPGVAGAPGPADPSPKTGTSWLATVRRKVGV